MTADDLTPEALDALSALLADRVARFVAADEAWSWHDATDDTMAGYGHHMSQMLARLPRDTETRDMKTSIDAMVNDLAEVLCHLPALIAAARQQNESRWRIDDQERITDTLRAERDAARAEVAALRERVEALRLALNADADYLVTKGSIGHRLRAALDPPADRTDDGVAEGGGVG